MFEQSVRNILSCTETPLWFGMYLYLGRFQLLTYERCCLQYKPISTVESAKLKIHPKQQIKTTKNTMVNETAQKNLGNATTSAVNVYLTITGINQECACTLIQLSVLYRHVSTVWMSEYRQFLCQLSVNNVKLYARISLQVLVEWTQWSQLKYEHDAVRLADANHTHDVTVVQRRHDASFLHQLWLHSHNTDICKICVKSETLTKLASTGNKAATLHSLNRPDSDNASELIYYHLS